MELVLVVMASSYSESLANSSSEAYRLAGREFAREGAGDPFGEWVTEERPDSGFKRAFRDTVLPPLAALL